MIKDTSNKTFFKYYKIDQYFFSSMINNELYFSNPRFFNDPFDSNPRFTYTQEIGKLKELFHFLRETINEKHDLLNSFNNYSKRKKKSDFVVNVLLNAIKSFERLFDPESKGVEDRLIEIFSFYNYSNIFEECVRLDLRGFQTKLYEDFTFLMIDFYEYGVTCGSMTETCPVMWGHYGNNHTGVCIEFEIKDDSGKEQISYDTDLELHVADVEYNSNPINLFSINNKEFSKYTSNILNTKSQKWSYEREVRLITKTRGLVKFKKTCLKKVIFGSKSTAKDRYTVCKLLASLGYDFEFLIARIQLDNYEMKIDTMQLHDIAGSGFYFEELNLREPIEKL